MLFHSLKTTKKISCYWCTDGIEISANSFQEYIKDVLVLSFFQIVIRRFRDASQVLLAVTSGSIASCLILLSANQVSEPVFNL